MLSSSPNETDVFPYSPRVGTLAASITGTSDNEAFTVVTKNDVAVGESNIEVHYKPNPYYYRYQLNIIMTLLNQAALFLK